MSTAVHNSGPNSVTTFGREKEMELYDALPEAVRRAVASAPYQYVIEEIWDAITEQPTTVRDAALLVKRTGHRDATIAYLKMGIDPKGLI